MRQFPRLWHDHCCTRRMQQKNLTTAYHLVARTHYPAAPLRNPETAAKAWQDLRKSFPNCIAAVLMPNHLHLIYPAADGPDALRRRLQRLFHGTQWEKIPDPRPIPNQSHLRTQVRYTHLNPCRKGLCADPLAWPWSTHRDYAGATKGPWPEVKGTLPLLGYSASDDGRRAFHRYISADPSAHPSGTPFPQPPARPILIDLFAVERAAELVCRLAPGQLRRQGRLRAQLMRLLRTEFQIPASKIAAHFDVHWSAVKVSRGTQSEKNQWLQPLLLTLSDQRLMQHADHADQKVSRT